MGFLLVLLLCISPCRAQGETVSASLTVSPAAAPELPDVPDLRAGLRRLFDLEFGSIVSVDLAGPATGAAARIAVDVAGDRVQVSTDFTRAGATRSLVSTLPRGSPASLLATAAGDLAFLFFSARGFSTLPLSPPPAMTAALSTATLGALTGWNPDELEPIALCGSGDEVTLCFPHRYLTLGRRFRITESTVRDMNAQSVEKEPLQLSGLVARPGDTLLLLSQQAGAMVEVDRRQGTRRVIPALGLSALPARLAGAGTLVSLPGATGAAGLLLYPVAGPGGGSGGDSGAGTGAVPAAGTVRTLPVGASYLSALDEDREGNLWVWDAGERRVRIVTIGGREVFSIRPLFSAATMPLPQQLAVFDDGSFLLAGSGEVWKFQGSGIPVWRLARIPGRPGESLPSSFDVSVDRSGATLTILDAQSRRLLAFSPAPASEEVRLAGLLARLDTRKPADVREAFTLARLDGLALMAVQFAGAARSGGLDAERTQARIALLAEKAQGYAGLADGLARDLLLEKADGAYVRASAALREWSAEAPGDQSAASLLQAVLARRREVRTALLGPADLRVVSARLLVQPGSGCVPQGTLAVTLRNGGAQPVTEVRLHVNLPSLSMTTPSLAAMEAVAALGTVDLLVPLGPVDERGLRAGAAVSAFAMVTWQRGQEGASSGFTFPVPLPRDGWQPDLARALACRAVGQDTLAAGLADAMLGGVRPTAPAPLADLAAILDSLGASRRIADRPEVSSPEPLPMRSSLRGLSGEEGEWAVVTASVASSLGVPASIVTRGARPLVAVDTGVPFFTAIGAVPGLDRFQAALASVSPAGTLWVPLSCRLPPDGAAPAAWAFADGVEALAAPGPDAQRAELTDADAAQNAPIPFPLVLPSITARRSASEVFSAAGAALDGIPAR